VSLSKWKRHSALGQTVAEDVAILAHSSALLGHIVRGHFALGRLRGEFSVSQLVLGKI